MQERPISVKDARSGQPIRVFRHSEVGKLRSKTIATHNGRPCFLLEVETRFDVQEIYVGKDHVVWEV